MNADESHFMKALRFEHLGIGVTVTDRNRFWLWVFWGTESAFIGVYRRFLHFPKVKHTEGYLEYLYWIERQKTTDCGTRASQSITVIVDLYREHLKHPNFADCFRKCIQPEAGEFPFLCLEFGKAAKQCELRIAVEP